MPAAGIPLGDILADSGYAHRDAAAWAIPLRLAGAQLVQDLHPHDRGPRGTHHGAIIANGNLYCPATPTPLLELGPLARDATPDQAAAHDQQTAETARHKLGKITADDADGYHRVMCPAAMGKIRCPLRPASMTLDRNRPEILTPPEHPPACCGSRPSPCRPRSTAKTRRNTTTPQGSTAGPTPGAPAPNGPSPPPRTPPATTSPAAGTRLMGLTPLMLWLACLLAVRNQRILDAWDARQADNARRAAAGLRPGPAAGAARPSPTWPPQAPRHDPARRNPRTVTRPPQLHRHARRSQPCPERPARPRRKPRKTAHERATAREMSDPNVNMVPGET